jgi:hypothetical protein
LVAPPPPPHESQHRTSNFWSKTLPSYVDNQPPFEKQFLACYWALIEIRHFTMGHQLSTCMMNWVIADSPTHKVGHARQHPILGWKCHVQAQHGLEAQVAQGSDPHSYFTVSSACPHVQLWGPGLPSTCRYHLKVASCSTTAHFCVFYEGS